LTQAARQPQGPTYLDIGPTYPDVGGRHQYCASRPDLMVQTIRRLPQRAGRNVNVKLEVQVTQPRLPCCLQPSSAHAEHSHWLRAVRLLDPTPSLTSRIEYHGSHEFHEFHHLLFPAHLPSALSVSLQPQRHAPRACSLVAAASGGCQTCISLGSK
jgi:hypothetical protein